MRRMMFGEPKPMKAESVCQPRVLQRLSKRVSRRLTFFDCAEIDDRDSHSVALPRADIYLVCPNYIKTVSCIARSRRQEILNCNLRDGMLRQAVYGRLASYADVNDADRLALDQVMRQIVGSRAVDVQTVSDEVVRRN